jgi:hypothetical protein
MLEIQDTNFDSESDENQSKQTKKNRDEAENEAFGL